MLLTKRERPVLVVNLIYLGAFSALAVTRSNMEFLLYAVIVLFVAAWILVKQRTLRLDISILWGLTVWGIMHMSGGLIRIGDGILYEWVVIPFVRRGDLVVLRFDQCVHAFGFGVATLLCYHVLASQLRANVRRGVGFWMLIVLMGCGVGAANEIVEFIAVLVMPETGVGGYENTMLDLVFNAIGAVAAVLILAARPRLHHKTSIPPSADLPPILGMHAGGTAEEHQRREQPTQGVEP